jgi:hypothetical protein
MDTFHPYADLVRAVGESAGREVRPFEPARDEHSGAVRLVAFSATCEHAGEVYDAALLGRVVAFLEAALGTRSPGEAPGRGGAADPDFTAAPWLVRPPLEASLLFVARVALAAAAALLGLALARPLGLLGAAPAGLARLLGARGPAIARRILSASLLALALAPLLLARAGVAPLSLARDAAPALLAGAVLSNAVVRRRALGATLDARSIAATSLAVYAAWIGGTVIGALPALRAHPDLALGLPLYLWQGVALRLHFTLETLGGKLVPASLELPWSMAAIAAVEIAAPGRALGFLLDMGLRLVRALGGPVTIPALPAPGAAAPSPPPPPPPRRGRMRPRGRGSPPSSSSSSPGRGRSSTSARPRGCSRARARSGRSPWRASGSWSCRWSRRGSGSPGSGSSSGSAADRSGRRETEGRCKSARRDTLRQALNLRSLRRR